jgi:hypothetical protein
VAVTSALSTVIAAVRRAVARALFGRQPGDPDCLVCHGRSAYVIDAGYGDCWICR